MAFDFKKEYRAFYMAAAKPEVVSVPAAKYVAVRGHGDPNEPDGAYQAAVAVLYAVAYTIKMSKLGDHRIDGYFDFVVPPLESFWQQAGVDGVDLSNKAAFEWIAVIRLPDFVTEADVLWAAQEASRRKKAGLLPSGAPDHRRGPLCPDPAHGPVRHGGAVHRAYGRLCAGKRL